MPLPFMLWGEQRLFTRLYRRFRLTETPGIPEAYPVLRSIQPVTQADTLLRVTKCEQVYSADPGAVTQFLVIATVPNGKRWQVHIVDLEGETGTTMATKQLYLQDPGGTIMTLATYTAVRQYIHEFQTPLPMDEGWQLLTWLTVYQATKRLDVNLVYYEEDAF